MIMERRGVLMLSLLLALVSCSSSTKPHRDVPAQERPFYYDHGGTRIYLGLDSSRVIVSTTLPVPDSVLSVLDEIGVGVESVTRHWKVNHFIVWFTEGTTSRQASEAALALRLTRGINFASNAYYLTPQIGRVFVLVDEFWVRFAEGTEPHEIKRLNRRVGAQTLRKYGADSLRMVLSYPVNSESTPLEVVAYYYERPIVEQARPYFSSQEAP